jgi:predicted phosphodiesterase
VSARPPSTTARKLDGVAAISSNRREVIEIDGKRFIYQHGYRMGKVTYVTRLPLTKSMTVWIAGHVGPEEIEASLRGENAFMLV